MALILVHGFTKDGNHEVVYHGTNGIAAQDAAKAAKESGRFKPHQLFRLVNPSGTPLPTVPDLPAKPPVVAAPAVPVTMENAKKGKR